MSELIRLGCTVADVYHRYQEIHGTLFGVSLLKRTIGALRGDGKCDYSGGARTLTGLHEELTALEPQISDPENGRPVTGADRELRSALLAYTRYLSQAMVSLENICSNLGRDEAAYRTLREDGRSQFTADKLEYDQLLSELERMGTRLEKLFANY